MKNDIYEYDIALSFAGEQRNYVDHVYNCLVGNGIRVYYDKDQDLWGKDLFIEFSNVYNKKSKYIVVFISKEYAEKNWTRHEIGNAFARALEEETEYILPVRFDDTDIPGLRSTIHFEDASKLTPEELCGKIVSKLNPNLQISPSHEDEIELPIIKRKITDFERDNYLKNSFIVVRNYFTKALLKTEENHKNVKTNLEAMNESKFIAKIYVDGNLKTTCKIWIGSGFSSNGSILYLHGSQSFNFGNDCSYNDSVSVKDNGIELYFNISNIGFGIVDKNINLERASAKDVAVYFWKKFIQNLNY